VPVAAGLVLAARIAMGAPLVTQLVILVVTLLLGPAGLTGPAGQACRPASRPSVTAVAAP
jgi:hypothetical protein